MNDKTKLILKIIGVIMGGIAGVIGVTFLFSALNFSCISKPEVIKDELPICRDAKYIAYAFHAAKDKVPETVISIGLASCRNQLTFDYCTEKTKDIADDNKRKDAFQGCWDKTKSQ